MPSLLIAIVSLLSCTHKSSSWLTGYVPDADYPENPFLPEPESILHVKRIVNHDCFCGMAGSPESNATDLAKDDLLAAPYEFPWTVYLRINNSLPGKYSQRDKPLRGRNWTWAEREGHHDCVGTIINDLFILTSSGCILNYYPDEDSPLSKQLSFEMWIKKSREIKPSEIYAYTNLTFKTKGVLQRHLIIDKIYYHAQTNYATRNFVSAEDNDFDIVLLRLKNRLKFGGFPAFNPICLPTPNLIRDYNFIYTFVNGWFSRPRYVFRSNENIDKLHEVKVGAIYDKCEDTYKEGVMLPNYLCSHHPLDYMDAGSSLVTKTKSNRAFLLGVLSWIVPHLSGNLSIAQNQDRIDQHIRYGLFSKIASKPIQSFIDYHTKREGAHWCQEPEKAKFVIRPFIGYEEPPPIDETINILNSCECGRTNSSAAKPKVVGGQETEPYEFPWLVWLFIQGEQNKGTGSSCGASIINDRLLLTAAHCVTREPKKGVRTVIEASRVFAFLHTHDPKNENHNPPRGLKTLQIEYIQVHAGYLTVPPNRKDENAYDIALLLLPERLDLKDPMYNPICLPRRSDTIDIYEGRKATVAGWGIIHRDPPITSGNKKPPAFADEAQKLEVPLHTVERCKTYHSIGYAEHFLCADDTGLSGAGQGDSGGPLFMDLSSERKVQIGVVSYGVDKRHQKPKPYDLITFYTRTTFFLDWIEFYSEAYEAHWCKRRGVPT